MRLPRRRWWIAPGLLAVVALALAGVAGGQGAADQGDLEAVRAELAGVQLDGLEYEDVPALADACSMQ